MKPGLRIAIFGSSLVSAYWNGAATYYRGLVRALHARGHHITFYEPDAFERQSHRDIDDPSWATSVVYSAHGTIGVEHALERARAADVVIKCSGVGVFDELLDAAVADLRTEQRAALFLDVDAPATLDRVQTNTADPFRNLIPRYDAILTYGGGPPVINAYKALRAAACVPIYNAVDPETHHRVEPDPRFAGHLSFLGNRLPDREARVDEYFFATAALLPDRTFVLGGSGWQTRQMPANVKYQGHVYTRQHNAFNVTPMAVLNINRDSMARYGYSPATRVFEAAGAAACLITDAWVGIESFLEPGSEVLVAACAEGVGAHLESLDDTTARAIGQRAQARVLASHTYAHRAEQLEALLTGSTVPAAVRTRSVA